MVIQKPEVKFTKIFINNEWHKSVSGKTFPTINPCDGSKITDVEEGDKADIYKAVEAARNAFQLNSPWRTMDASARGRLMYKLADLVERDKDYLARLEVLDNGKTYGFASFETDFSANAIRYCAGFCDKLHGKTIPSDGDVFAYTRLDALGVVGLIVPWNYPVMLEICGAAQALCAGNCLVLKSAEQTPLTSLYFASLVKEAGFPPGVFNVVPGYGPTAGAALTEHMDVDKVSFTGSLEVGRIIQEASAKSNLKKLTLELGGKSPLIICADADLDVAAPIAVEACFINQGQTCAAGTRTFVHKSIYDKFVEKCVKLAAQRKVGDPFQEDTIQGPQIDEEQFNKILNFIQTGLKEGATLKTGGRRWGHSGYFIEPTVFADVKDHMTIAREEIFGPVMQILKYSTLEEVIKRANGTNYGLAAGIVTNDINTAHTLAQALRAGLVWVNTYMALSPQIPFGGYKESGIGRSFGEDGIKQYLEIKSVVTKIPKKNC